MSELVVALFGFGRLARDYYLPALHELDEPVRLVIVDPALASRDAAKAAWPLAALYEDGAAMFNHEMPDAAVIASPPSTHLALWKIASAHRVPVLMEKPFPLPAEVNSVEGDARAASATMVNFNRRHWGEYQELARRIRDLGLPAHISFTLQTDPVAWSTVTRHRFDKSEGGALADLGSHAIDLLVWFTGQWPESISGSRRLPFTPREQVAMKMAFPNGSTAEVHIGYGPKNIERVEVTGPRNTILLANPNGRIWNMRTPGLFRSTGDILLLAGRAANRNRLMMRATIASALRLFLASIRSGSPQCNLAHATRCAQILARAQDLQGEAI